MYYLMNKDDVVATFEVEGKGAFEHITISAINPDSLYPWISENNLESFILGRRAPKNRPNINRLYSLYDLKTTSRFLDTTLALSLNDTLWVKNSTENMSWKDVSLYQNPFNPTIARLTLDGTIHSQSPSDIFSICPLSPEFTTNGRFAKCWTREEDAIYLLKSGTDKGIEPYSEFYSSQVLAALGVRFVDYDLISKNNKVISKCSIFTDENVGCIPFNLLEKSVRSLPTLVSWYKEKGYLEDLASMLVADALIGNTDRHFGNFGFLFDTATGKILEVAPLFDHNLSMFCYVSEENLQNIRQEILTYDIGHFLGGSFEEVAKELLTPSLRKKLLNMRGFNLQKHPQHNLSEERLKYLNDYIKEEIELILK